MAKGAYIGVENFTPRTLPSGFTQVEYLKSSGTQYIDTGFKHNQNTRICIDIQNTQSKTTTWAFGGRISGTTATIGVFYWTNNNLWGADYNGSGQRYSFSSLKADDRLIIDYNKNILTINEYVKKFSAGTFQSTANLALLAVNTGGTVSGYMSARLYSCKIYDNGTLIRDYVPCVNSSGVAGLFDLACNTFCTNDGTGTFAAGPIFSAVARKVNKAYIGVSGIARKIKKAYVGVGGVARLFYSSDPVITAKSNGNTSDSLSWGYGVAAASNGKYCIFGPAAGRTENNILFNDYSTSYGSAYNESLTKTKVAFSAQKNYYGAENAGNYAVFAGGYGYENYTLSCSSTVEAYDKSLTSRSATDLSYASQYPGSASIAGNAIFAGGSEGSSGTSVYSHPYVDAYNSSLTKKKLTNLRDNYYHMAGATATSGDKSVAIFSGGADYKQNSISYRVAYDEKLTQLSVSSLSKAGIHTSGVTTGKCAVFTGSSSFAMDTSLTQVATLSPLNGNAWAHGIAHGYFISCNQKAVGTLYDSSFTGTIIGGPTLNSLVSGYYDFGHGSVGQRVLFGGGMYQNVNNRQYYGSNAVWSFSWTQE